MAHPTHRFDEMRRIAMSVPYLHRDRVINDAHLVLENVPHLNPKFTAMTRMDGSRSNVLALDGLVQTTYHGASYMTPIVIFVPEAYPDHPPIAYVTQASGLYIVPGHKHVDTKGQVYLPYISEWRPATSNLVDLIGMMASVFSAMPPLRAGVAPPAPVAATPAPAWGAAGGMPATATATTATRPMSMPATGVYAGGTGAAATSAAAAAAGGRPASTAGVYNNNAASAAAEDRARRDNLARAITGRLRDKLGSVLAAQRSEFAALSAAQTELTVRGQRATAISKALEAQIGELEEYERALDARIEGAKAWITAAQGAKAGIPLLAPATPAASGGGGATPLVRPSLAAAGGAAAAAAAAAGAGDEPAASGAASSPGSSGGDEPALDSTGSGGSAAAMGAASAAGHMARISLTSPGGIGLGGFASGVGAGGGGGGGASGDAPPSVEESLTGLTALQQQLLDAVAEVAAIDDLFFHLDAAHKEGKFDTETLLAEVKSLARRQFSQRFIAKKADRLLAGEAARRAQAAGGRVTDFAGVPGGGHETLHLVRAVSSRSAGGPATGPVGGGYGGAAGGAVGGGYPMLAASVAGVRR